MPTLVKDGDGWIYDPNGEDKSLEKLGTLQPSRQPFIPQPDQAKSPLGPIMDLVANIAEPFVDEAKERAG